MRRKPPFKILCSSDSVVARKKFIFIFVRIIISLEKNPRKPVSILGEEIGDFKLLKHIHHASEGVMEKVDLLLKNIYFSQKESGLHTDRNTFI